MQLALALKFSSLPANTESVGRGKIVKLFETYLGKVDVEL